MNSTQFDNLRVAIRVRPALPREREPGIPFRSIAIISNEQKSISLAEYLGAELDERERQREWMEHPNWFQLHRFTFDSVFDLDSTQSDVYDISAKQAVQSVLEGYNSTIFAYGQTGTGKTYTMEGFTYNSGDPERGIIQRTIEEIFSYIESTSSENTKFIIRASYWQIYNENISDWLKPEKRSLQIHEDKKKGIYVDCLSEWAVRSPIDLYAWLKRGASFRATASTYMNDVSSRSHAVFLIIVEQMTIEDNRTQIKVGKLNLVDLAGSERIRITGATGQQLEESKKINKSWSCWGNVINALTDQKGRIHIPYRDSKLTRLLEDSLGGNCKTTMIAMISPAHESFNESWSTLHFAQRAKKIKNRPIVNEDLNNRALIRQYEIQWNNLKKELESKNRMIQSNELVMQLQEQKKQAEQDKNEAIRELEVASKRYIWEREEKQNLEKKIQLMISQMITGGHKIEETPQFQSALKNQLREYNNKIMEIERERQQIEEDKAETQQYKDLLLKQRDIMNAWTNKLNERDEAIAQLQEEIDTYDKQDEINDYLVNHIKQLEGWWTHNNIKYPRFNNQTLTKKTNKRLDQTYLPYEAEINYKQFDNQPLVMLTPDEKINELRSWINEKESKIHFLDMLSQKFITTLGKDGSINVNKFLEQMNKQKDMNENIKMINKQAETITNLQTEIDRFSEIIEEKNKELEARNYAVFEVKSEMITQIENIFKIVNDATAKKELFKLYQLWTNGEGDIGKSSTNHQINTKVSAKDPQYSSAVNGWEKGEVNKYLTNSNTLGNQAVNKQVYSSQGQDNKMGSGTVNNKLSNEKYINKFLNTNK